MDADQIPASMVERAARAMWVADGSDPATWDAMAPTRRASLLVYGQARAVLAAALEGCTVCERLGLEYEVPRDWWIGVYIAPTAVYACPLPCLVIRWSRAVREVPECLTGSATRTVSRNGKPVYTHTMQWPPPCGGDTVTTEEIEAGQYTPGADQ